MSDIILNSTDSLKKWLMPFYREVKEVKHLGNFVFEAITDLGTIKVLTTPVNEECTKIRIVNVLK